MTVTSVYHEGELLVQKRTGEEERGSRTGRVISDRINPGAIPFLSEQSMVVMGSVDDEGDVWASLLLGTPGFITAPDDRTLDFDLAQIAYDEQDPFWSNLAVDQRVGMLAIDVVTRRRFRVNGNLNRLNDEALRLEVLEAYPNCPKYIQRRHSVQRHGEPVEGIDPSSGDLLSPAQLAHIRTADTFFVASAHSERGVDVSHRGGNPGFVQILDERTLRIPDFTGNSMYQTLGNFVTHPRAGLLFIDYEASRTLQLIGTPQVRFDLDEPSDRTGGTHRYWDFTVDGWLERPLPHRIEWQLLDYSPFNPIDHTQPQTTANTVTTGD